MTATDVGNRRVQDNADTGNEGDDHIIGPHALPVSSGPAPTVPVSCGPAPTDVKVEEEMCKKDEFSPATSERGVQDKVDESDVAKDDCLRDPRKATTASPSEEKCDEPKKWGPTQKRRAGTKRKVSNTDYNISMRVRKSKRDQRFALHAYAPDVAVPSHLQRGTRNDPEMIHGHRSLGRLRHDPVNNIAGMSTSTHEPSSESGTDSYQKMMRALGKILAT